DWVDWLDVVVVVEEDREAGSSRLVAVDGRSTSVAAKLPRLETRTGQQLLHELRGLVERTPLGRDARLPAPQVEHGERSPAHAAGVGSHRAILRCDNDAQNAR